MDNASVSKKGNMNDKKEYPTAAKLLSWLPAIFVAAAICWFSAQPAAESTEMSDTVSRLILLLGTKLGFFHGNPAQYADLIELMSFPVRKAAHMTEYLVFYCTVRFGLHFTDLQHETPSSHRSRHRLPLRLHRRIPPALRPGPRRAVYGRADRLLWVRSRNADLLTFLSVR